MLTWGNAIILALGINAGLLEMSNDLTYLLRDLKYWSGCELDSRRVAMAYR
jgi:hypothetical protein